MGLHLVRYHRGDSATANVAYLEFCQGDPYFYDLPRVIDEAPFSVDPLPRGWSSSITEGWHHVRPPVLRLPVQGWKIHVSTTPQNAEMTLSRTAKACAPETDPAAR